MQLVAAVAAQRPEHVAGQAFAVHPHQHRLAGRDVALDQGDVGLFVRAGLKGHGAERAESRGQGGLGHLGHGHMAVAHAVADEVGHGGDLEIVLVGELDQVRHPGHVAVFAHDLADDAGGLEAGQAGEVHAAFGLAGAVEHAAFAGAQGKDVARGDEVFGHGPVGHGGQDGGGPVIGRDAGGHADLGFDGDGKAGAKRRLVVLGHHGQGELVHEIGGQRQANEPPAVGGHEIDDFRGDLFGGDGEVAFVFAVFVVDEDDHPSGADVLDGVLDGA